MTCINSRRLPQYTSRVRPPMFTAINMFKRYRKWRRRCEQKSLKNRKECRTNLCWSLCSMTHVKGCGKCLHEAKLILKLQIQPTELLLCTMAGWWINDSYPPTLKLPSTSSKVTNQWKTYEQEMHRLSYWGNVTTPGSYHMSMTLNDNMHAFLRRKLAMVFKCLRYFEMKML